MITREEMNLILEREGISQFINARSFDKETGIYETANGYYGMVFRIFPSPYLGAKTESKIASFLNMNFPKDSVVQFITYSSRNITKKIKEYTELHTNPTNNIFKKPNVKNEQFLKIIAESNIEWTKKYSNRSIFEKEGLDVYLRDFINLAVLMIPKEDEHGAKRSMKSIISIFAQTKGSLAEFRPMVFSQKEYVKMLREILNPSFPMWDMHEDTMSTIDSQISDINSAVELAIDGKIVFGKLTDDDGNRIELDNQVEPPKTISYKLKEMAAEFFKMAKPKKEELKINPEWYSTVLTTKIYPEYMSLYKMSNIFMDYLNKKPQPLIPIPFLCSLTISIGDRDKLIEKVKADAKWNTFQLSGASGAAKFMPELKDRAIEAREIIGLSSKGEVPFKAMWSLSLFSKDENKLDEYTASVQKEFLENNNWFLQKEDGIQLPVLLYSLPLQYDKEVENWSQRFNTLFKSNNTAITPIMSDSRGFGKNVIQLIGRSGQMQGLDIFDKSATNKNFVTVAPSGSGKSFFMAYFFLNYLMTGAKIRIIDSGESYLKLCEVVGGRYIRFAPESNTCFNFFSTIATDSLGEITEDAIESIVPIIGMMAKQDLNKQSNENTTSQDDLDRAVLYSYVADAVRSAYDMEGINAGMREVYLSLQNEYNKQKRGIDSKDGENHDVDKKLRDIIIALKQYGEESGEYFKYYNGRKNVHFSDNDFVVLEMKELETKGNFRNVVLMTLAFDVESEFYFEDERKKKIFTIDEAWSLIDHPIVAKFVEGLYRKSRKFGGAVGTITQGLADYDKNDSTRAMYQNSYWKFFLSTDPSELKKAITEGTLTMDEFTFELASSVRTEPGVYSDVMVRTKSGAMNIGRVVSNRTLYWLFTTSDDDKAVIKNVNENFGLDNETIAALSIGYAEDSELSIEDAIKEVMSANIYNDIDHSEQPVQKAEEDELLELL